MPSGLLAASIVSKDVTQPWKTVSTDVLTSTLATSGLVMASQLEMLARRAHMDCPTPSPEPHPAVPGSPPCSTCEAPIASLLAEVRCAPPPDAASACSWLAHSPVSGAALARWSLAGSGSRSVALTSRRRRFMNEQRADESLGASMMQPKWLVGPASSDKLAWT